MARSASQIEQSMRNTLSQINPSLDFKVGPTYDYTLRPVPPELAFTESQVERLLRFYSGDFPIVATPVEARSFANNFGIALSLGERARGTITFFRSSPPPPGAVLTIPVGSLVSTRDNTLIYQVIETRTMIGDFADTYFNPTTNRYEVQVPVQATAPGILFNVPPFRISRILTPQIDFDGVAQIIEIRGGSEPETSFDLVNRVISQFKGLNLGSITGVAGIAKRFIPTGILDLKVIRPTDRLEFRRPTSGPSLDLCVSGFDTQIFVEEYFATGGESSIVLKRSTAVGVSSVSINGVVLTADDWAFVADPTPEYRGSTRASNKLEFLASLNPNDIVDIIGTHNALLERVQALFSPNEMALFKTDTLARSYVDQPIVVGIELKVKNSPNFDLTEIQNLLTATVVNYIEPFRIPEELRADLLKDMIRSTVPNIDSVRVSEFRRRYASLESVEVIRPLKNEIPKYDFDVSALIVKV